LRRGRRPIDAAPALPPEVVRPCAGPSLAEKKKKINKNKEIFLFSSLFLSFSAELDAWVDVWAKTAITEII
jgi:hypothetical protein